MTDISFEKAVRQIKQIREDFQDVVENPELAVEKSKDIISNEILVNDQDFFQMYGVSFKEAQQKQRDEYIGLMKYMTNITNEIAKAVKG